MFYHNSFHFKKNEELVGKCKFTFFLYPKKITDKKDTIINIFSLYIEPLIKEINYPELLQEWKLNLDSTDYKQNIDANLYKLPENKIQSS